MINSAAINEIEVNGLPDRSPVFFSVSPTISPATVTFFYAEVLAPVLSPAPNLYSPPEDYDSVGVIITTPESPFWGVY